jgi:hypothetical protein
MQPAATGFSGNAALLRLVAKIVIQCPLTHDSNFPPTSAAPHSGRLKLHGIQESERSQRRSMTNSVLKLDLVSMKLPQAYGLQATIYAPHPVEISFSLYLGYRTIGIDM